MNQNYQNQNRNPNQNQNYQNQNRRPGNNQSYQQNARESATRISCWTCQANSYETCSNNGRLRTCDGSQVTSFLLFNPHGPAWFTPSRAHCAKNCGAALTHR